jgi:hypothetical protein
MFPGERGQQRRRGAGGALRTAAGDLPRSSQRPHPSRRVTEMLSP